MRKSFIQKWEPWVEKRPKDFAVWAISYILKYESLPPQLLKPFPCALPNLSDKELWERNRDALFEYLRKLPEEDGSHLFLNRLQTAWRAKQQEERDKVAGINRIQLMVDSETLKTAKEVAKLHKTTTKSALELMLNNNVDTIQKLKNENDSLRYELKNPRPEKRVEALEKDLAIVFEELEKLREYSLSHIEEYCRLAAEKRAEERPRLSPEQHDQALIRIKEKKQGINELLNRTTGIQARYQKKLGKRFLRTTITPTT